MVRGGGMYFSESYEAGQSGEECGLKLNFLIGDNISRIPNREIQLS